MQQDMKSIHFVIIPVTVSIGELTSGVFKVIFLVKAEVKSCNRRKKPSFQINYMESVTQNQGE